MSDNRAARRKQVHTSHAECDHEKTPVARAKCRKARAAGAQVNADTLDKQVADAIRAEQECADCDPAAYIAAGTMIDNY